MSLPRTGYRPRSVSTTVTATRPERGFREPGHIRVVAENGGKFQSFAEPISQRKTIPPGNLMRLDYRTSGIINRTAEPNTDAFEGICLELGCREQFRHSRQNLSANAFAAGRYVNRSSP